MTTQRIVGIVNALGYRIVDIVSKSVLKVSGNNPASSLPTDSLPIGQGASVETLKKWCEMEGSKLRGWRGARIE